MIKSIKRKLIVTEALLVVLFSSIGCLYLVYVLPRNSDQLRLVVYTAICGVVVLGVPMVVFQPLFRSIERDLRRMEAGETLGPEELNRFLRRVLIYPVKVAFWAFMPT